MTKKMFLAFVFLFLSSNITQPIYQVGIDYNTFYKYVSLAEDELINITAQVKDKVHYYIEIIWIRERNVHYIETLYQHQKKFLKTLVKFVKATKDKAFSDKFEHEIYKQWKKTFKKNYKNSLATDDWSWFHKPFYFAIQE